MKNDIKNGLVTLELSPPDCLALVNISRATCQDTIDENVDWWEAFFHACAVAGYSQWHTRPADEQTIDEQLVQIGLRF